MQTVTKAENGLSVDTLKHFIERHYLKNRTMVTADIAEILDDIEAVTGLPLIRHRFKSGEDYGTWVIPPQWDVKEAWLKNSRGEIIASYRHHPMFLGLYSTPVHRTLSKEELLRHVVTNPSQPDAYTYSVRYLCDARQRLGGWEISLPQNVVNSLNEGPFEIFIDTEVKDGELLIGEIVLPGKSDQAVMFLADYCHPGQCNDSFSGLAMFMKLMCSLSLRKERHYTYRLLVMPEMIGSVAYIVQDPARIKNVFAAIFSDSVGYGKDWYIKGTREANTYMDLLSSACRRIFKGVETRAFRDAYGNDELIFDSVQVNIPTLSVFKYPFPEYHTSNDSPSRLNGADIEYAHNMILYMVDVLERDAVFGFTVPVPFWMTRFGLYSDYGSEEYHLKFDIVYRYLDGKRSLLEISELLNVPFEKVFSFVREMESCGLVKCLHKYPHKLC